MGQISLEDVQPGMVLASDVFAARDRLLLAAGAEISERHLRIFRTWGVGAVDVEGVTRDDIAARAAAGLDPGARAAVEARVQTLFRRTDREHPVVRELMELTILRLVRQAGQGRTVHGA